MILLILFLSFWLGILFKSHIVIIVLTSLAFLFFVFKKYSKKMLSLSLCFLIGGIAISFIKIDYSSTSYQGVVYEAKDNYFLFNTKGMKLYVYEKENNYEIGDILTIEGEKTPLDFSVLESGFNFKEYLNNKGVDYQLNIKKCKIDFSFPVRNKLIRRNFLSHFDKETSSLMSSVLFSSNIDSDINNLSSDLHLSRLLSISGVYVYLFINLFSFLFSFIVKKRKYSDILSIIFLFIYFIFTFPKFSVVKILFLQILKWINKYLLNKKFSYFTILAFTGFIFLLFDYHLAYQDGFVLGYLIPIMFPYINKLFKKQKNFLRKPLASIVIFFFFVPFEIKYNNCLNLFSFPFQIILTPFFMAFALVGLLCFYRLPLYNIALFFKTIISNLCGFFSLFNIGINVPPLNDYFFFAYLVIYFLFLYYFSIKFKPIYKSLIYIEAIFMCIYCFPINNLLTYEVDFINVGQGDCCFIRYQTTEILIDTGGLTYTDLARDNLIPFFKKNRVYELDLVLTTHDDFDHSGALASLKQNFKVKNYINDYHKFPIKIGDITLINYNNHIDSVEEENEASLVIGFTIKSTSFLIMGDAPIKIEKSIIAEYDSIPCDILKVGHHGSNTSSCDEFIKFLSPKEAVISVGKNNKYGHPHETVIQILKRNNIAIKRTDYLGTVSYKNFLWNC